MAGGKHNKGCCETCPYFCMENGGSLCPIESTRIYLAEPQAVQLGTGSLCCITLLELVNEDDNTDCIWLSVELDCTEGGGLATLEITSTTEATITITFGAYTLVWVADPGYNPLCTSSFTYDAELSTPPEDCSWPEQFCVIPSEICCPDVGYPDTLYATVTVTRFPGACAAWTSGVAVIELTRIVPNDPDYYPGGTTAVRWEGSDELWPGGSVLDIVLTCVFTDVRGYRMFMDFPVSGCAPDSQDADETDITSCDPFIFTFTDVQNIDSCCTGGIEFDIVVTE